MLYWTLFSGIAWSFAALLLVFGYKRKSVPLLLTSILLGAMSLFFYMNGQKNYEEIGKAIKKTIRRKPKESDFKKPEPRSLGVIVCAGGFRTLEAIGGLSNLRRIEKEKSIPPVRIEWFYVGGGELTAADRRIIQDEVGPVDFIDVSKTYSDPKRLKSYAIKPYALTQSKFDHVLLLDSDCIPLIHPSELIASSDIYKQKGSLFWPDVFEDSDPLREKVIINGSKLVGNEMALHRPNLAPHFGKFKRDMEKANERVRSSESGQLLINRSRHKNAILKAWWLNEQKEIVYSNAFGDKDTFLDGFILSGKQRDFGQVDRSPALQFPEKGVSHLGLVHFTENGKPAFLHRTMQKRRCVSGIPCRLIASEYGSNKPYSDSIEFVEKVEEKLKNSFSFEPDSGGNFLLKDLKDSVQRIVNT